MAHLFVLKIAVEHACNDAREWSAGIRDFYAAAQSAREPLNSKKIDTRKLT
jgi:hypothetical protein